MNHRVLLCAALLLAGAAPAGAATVFVSNERDHTVSVLDSISSAPFFTPANAP